MRLIAKRRRRAANIVLVLELLIAVLWAKLAASGLVWTSVLLVFISAIYASVVWPISGSGLDELRNIWKEKRSRRSDSQ